jgi:DNA (cytosine-5)-methyltransferase 1
VVLRTLHICSGYGGFELALRQAGVASRTVAHVERDSYAAAILVERMAQQRLDQAPIWSDVATFDGRPWRGRVDIVTAGFPCPDFSSAGKRAGVHGEHWLWPDIFRVICDVGPRYVLLENVPGVVRLGGATRVLADLASVGFNAEWGVLAASAVGAPHKRERWWCLAYARGEGRSEVTGGVSGDEARVQRHGNGNKPDGGGQDVAHAQGVGWDEGHGQAARPRRAIAESGGWPPGRDDIDGWRRWIAAGGPEPVVRRLADGPPLGLADALHLGGNGLVPQCAAEAVRHLATRLLTGVIQEQ